MAIKYNGGLGIRSEEVLNQMRRNIQSGLWQAGSRLPVEHELCAQFKVSRNTLRRAVERLRADGLVTVRQGAGTFVNTAAGESPGLGTVGVMSMFGLEQLSRLQNQLLEQGYLLCLYCQAQNSWDAASERAFLQKLLELGSRGLLANCSPLEPLNCDLLAELAQRGTRVIHTGWHRPELPLENYLLPDYRAAGYRAGLALYNAGYHNLIEVRPAGEYPISALLTEGFAAAAKEFRQHASSAPSVHTLRFTASLPEQVDALCRDAGGPCGFFAQTREYGEKIAACLHNLGVALPTAAGVIGVPMPNEPALDQKSSIDLLGFDIDALLSQAVNLATAATPGDIRELVPPVWQRNGTVAERLAVGAGPPVTRAFSEA